MKTLLITLFVVIIAQGRTMAQHVSRLTSSTYAQKAQEETDNMTTRLSLTAVQKDSVLAINTSYYHQVVLLHSQTLSVVERKQQYDQLEQWRRDRLALHLSSGQMSQYIAGIELGKTWWQNKVDSLKAARSGQ